MFFTRIGVVISWLAFIMAAAHIGIAVYLGTSVSDPEQVAFWSTRYLGTRSPWAAVDRGAIVLALAIALGILTEISKAVRR